MAKNKSRQDDLFDRLRASGLRKRAARTIAAASEKADSTTLRKAVEDLRGLVGELESRVSGAVRSPEPESKPAARRGGTPKKAATTSPSDASKRSAAAKKAAATRAANSRARSTGTRPARPRKPRTPGGDGSKPAS